MVVGVSNAARINRFQAIPSTSSQEWYDEPHLQPFLALEQLGTPEPRGDRLAGNGRLAPASGVDLEILAWAVPAEAPPLQAESEGPGPGVELETLASAANAELPEPGIEDGPLAWQAEA